MHDKYEEIFNEEIEIFSKENFIKLNKDERLRNETYINSITSKITNKRLFEFFINSRIPRFLQNLVN